MKSIITLINYSNQTGIANHLPVYRVVEALTLLHGSGGWTFLAAELFFQIIFISLLVQYDMYILYNFILYFYVIYFIT